MQKFDEDQPLSSIEMPKRDPSSPDGQPVASAHLLLKQWQTSYLTNEGIRRVQGQHEEAEFHSNMVKCCEILSEMINPDAILNQRQCFWLHEALTNVPSQLTALEARASYKIAGALVGIAQWVNSCHP